MSLEIPTLLNGNILSAKSCQFRIDMIPRKGFVAVNYKEKIDAENVWDDSRDGAPVGSTYGRYSVESFTFTLLKAKWLELMPYLAAKGLGSIGNARFAFSAEYSEPLVPLFTLVDNISYARVVGIEDDYSEDIKALVVKVDLMALYMTRNGLSLNDPKRALPL